MRLIRIILLILLTTLIISSASKCGYTPVEFDPQFHKAKYQGSDSYLENRDNFKVYCSEPAFDDFACLTKEKIKELAEILDKAEIPAGTKEKLKEILREY